MMNPLGSAEDIVIVTSPYPLGDEAPLREIVLFAGCYQIADDVWLGDINSELTEAVMDACDPRYENFSPRRQYGSAYALIRLRAPAPDSLQFDPDKLLGAIAALSRLVHPTSIGFSYAARVRYPEYGGRQIIPGAPSNLNPHAFVSEELSDWLVPADVPALVDLVNSYQRKNAPQRVRSALWNHESAFRNYFLENRWAMIVTGIESLVHVRDEKDPRNGRPAGSTRVFAQRGSQLATILGIPGLGDAELRRSYAMRSEIVHGGGVPTAGAAEKTLYETTERLLSACIARALLDEEFAAQFQSDESVQSALPLT
jgi:hypothetical protein